MKLRLIIGILAIGFLSCCNSMLDYGPPDQIAQTHQVMDYDNPNQETITFSDVDHDYLVYHNAYEFNSLESMDLEAADKVPKNRYRLYYDLPSDGTMVTATNNRPSAAPPQWSTVRYNQPSEYNSPYLESQLNYHQRKDLNNYISASSNDNNYWQME